MRVLKVNIKLRNNDINQTFHTKNTLLLGDEERTRPALERLYPKPLFSIIAFDFIEENAFMGKHLFDLGQIDFRALSKQKAILINMIQDWGEADDYDQRKDAEEVEGLLNLLDKLQDYATDRLGYPQEEVFPNLEEEAEEVGKAIMELDEFDEWLGDRTIDSLDEVYEVAPIEVREALDSYDENGDSYEECSKVVGKLNALGYTADYGLSGDLYEFAKLNE